MRVMVIVKANPDSEAGILPSGEVLSRMQAYNEELAKAGVLVLAEGLESSAKGVRVRFLERERTVLPGPFAATRELVAGFWLWNVESLDAAVAWLKRAPFGEGAEVEIRRVFEPEDFAPVDPDGRLAQRERELRELSGKVRF